MKAKIQLLNLERNEGAERLVILFNDTGIELAVEARTVDGWALRRRIVVHEAEASKVADAMARGAAIVRTVRR